MQQWEMNEMFTFPKQLGNVLGNSKIVVEPKWHQEINDDSVFVRGIYVVKGNIQFDHVARNDEVDEGIHIEHIDIEKDHGYFEYALPFAIDFPNDNVEKIALRINNVKIEPNNGCCLCSWDVHCDVEKKVQAIEENKEITANKEVEEIKEAKATKEVEEIKELKVNKEIEEIKASAEPNVPIQQSFEEQLEEEGQNHILLQDESHSQGQLASEELDFLEQLADAYSRVQIHSKK